MDFPSCKSSKSKELKNKTNLGYTQYRCRNCHKQYNERTRTPLNFIEYPTEVVMITAHYYYRFKVSLDDVVELMAMRGFYLAPGYGSCDFRHMDKKRSIRRLKPLLTPPKPH